MAMDSEFKCQNDNGKKCLCRWWPLVLGPAAMIWVYIAQATGMGGLVSRGTNENMALVLVGISILGFGIQSIKYRREYMYFMLTLCAAFFCREWHFYGTSNGIYVALGLLSIWAFMRKDQLGSFFSGNAVEVWSWTAFSCYLLSQLIARRVFRYVHLPSEEEMHIFLEESVETMAHIVMIVTCIVSWVRAARMKRD